MDDAHHPALQALLRLLTPRERDVAEYLLMGKANKVIASDLGMSMRTVETHRSRIFRKVGVRNSTELVRLVYVPKKTAGASSAPCPGCGGTPNEAPPPPCGKGKKGTGKDDGAKGGGSA